VVLFSQVVVRFTVVCSAPLLIVTWVQIVDGAPYLLHGLTKHTGSQKRREISVKSGLFLIWVPWPDEAEEEVLGVHACRAVCVHQGLDQELAAPPDPERCRDGCDHHVLRPGGAHVRLVEVVAA
jgi:hypothetical protein